MLIEIMAGKAAAASACCYDATPFTFTDEDDPITYFGHCLRKGSLHRKDVSSAEIACIVAYSTDLALSYWPIFL